MLGQWGCLPLLSRQTGSRFHWEHPQGPLETAAASASRPPQAQQAALSPRLRRGTAISYEISPFTPHVTTGTASTYAVPVRRARALTARQARLDARGLHRACCRVRRAVVVS